MQTPAGNIHVRRLGRNLKESQYALYFGDVIRRNAPAIVLLIKALQYSGLEAPYHSLSVKQCFTHVKYQLSVASWKVWRKCSEARTVKQIPYDAGDRVCDGQDKVLLEASVVEPFPPQCPN